MEVYGGAPGAPAAAELMPSELYHQGGMRIRINRSIPIIRVNRRACTPLEDPPGPFKTQEFLYLVIPFKRGEPEVKC